MLNSGRCLLRRDRDGEREIVKRCIDESSVRDEIRWHEPIRSMPSPDQNLPIEMIVLSMSHPFGAIATHKRHLTQWKNRLNPTFALFLPVIYSHLRWARSSSLAQDQLGIVRYTSLMILYLDDRRLRFAAYRSERREREAKIQTDEPLSPSAFRRKKARSSVSIEFAFMPVFSAEPLLCK